MFLILVFKFCICVTILYVFREGIPKLRTLINWALEGLWEGSIRYFKYYFNVMQRHVMPSAYNIRYQHFMYII